MALLNDLKKLFFGAKSVTKSATGKVVESGKEAGKDLAGSGNEFLDKARHTAEDVGKVVLDKAENAMKKAGEFAEDVGEKILQTKTSLASKSSEQQDIQTEKATTIIDQNEELVPDIKGYSAYTDKNTGHTPKDTNEIMDEIMAESKSTPEADDLDMLELPPLKTSNPDPGSESAAADEDIFETLKKSGNEDSKTSDNLTEKTGDFAEGAGKKVMDKGSELAGKFGKTAEELGETIFEKGNEALDRTKDFANDLGSKILKAKDDLVAKAEAEAAKSGKSADSLTDKLKNLNQKMEDKISGNNQKFADKPLDTGGSEFKKHDSFWDKADKFSRGDYHMKGDQPKPGEMKIQQDPDYKSPEKGKVKGFDDRDGDGDELIDEAIIDDDK